MYLVIGKENCNACEMVKTILTNKKIDYTYYMLDELNEDDKKQYLKLAREQGIMSMPLIIKENRIIPLQEVIA